MTQERADHEPTADAVHAPDPPMGPKRPNRARIDEALAILSEELNADVVEGDGGERMVMVYPNPWWTIRLMPRAGTDGP